MNSLNITYATICIIKTGGYPGWGGYPRGGIRGEMTGGGGGCPDTNERQIVPFLGHALVHLGLTWSSINAELMVAYFHTKYIIGPNS